MRLVASLSLFVLAACGPNPCPSTAVTPDVPSEYGALYNNFDAERLTALFPANHPPKVANHRRTLTNLRKQLGECGAPQLMWNSGRSTRWTYACERGNLEAAFALDADGHVVRMDALAAGVPASAMMDTAARSLLAELPLAAGATRPFKHNLSDPSVRAAGRCELVSTWAVGETLGLFHTRCESGQDMVLGVRMYKGEILRVKLVPTAKIYKGMPM